MKTIKRTSQVQPGHRVEVVAPEFAEGDLVDVVILPRGAADVLSPESVISFIDALPDGPRACATWEEYERHLGQERNSWER